MNAMLQQRLEALIAIAACPEARTPLTIAPQPLVDRLNAAIGARSLRERSGTLLHEPLQSVLVRQDRQLAYPVREGIPVLLISAGIWLDDDDRGTLE